MTTFTEGIDTFSKSVKSVHLVGSTLKLIKEKEVLILVQIEGLRSDTKVFGRPVDVHTRDLESRDVWDLTG